MFYQQHLYRIINILNLNAQYQIEDVRIYNILGQLVMSTQPQSLDCEIDLSILEKGPYMMEVAFMNAKKTLRIIKQ